MNVLAQTHDPTRPITKDSISPLYRPRHSTHTTISTTLLQTCRLVYSEAHSIPLRSATHHFRHLGSTSFIYIGDVWLHHMTSQRGADLYHLHDNLVALQASNFSKFLLPHLKWRRLTWTVCAYLIPPMLAERREVERLAQTLAALVLPETCREVVLELESREDLGERWEGMREQARKCCQLALRRSGGEALGFDEGCSVQYAWMGSGQARWGTSENSQAKKSMEYCTLRLCWWDGTARREYISYDHLDCLRLEGCEEIMKIEALRL
jgi:hypothetical protein